MPRVPLPEPPGPPSPTQDPAKPEKINWSDWAYIKPGNPVPKGSEAHESGDPFYRWPIPKSNLPPFPTVERQLESGSYRQAAYQKALAREKSQPREIESESVEPPEAPGEPPPQPKKTEPAQPATPGQQPAQPKGGLMMPSLSVSDSGVNVKTGMDTLDALRKSGQSMVPVTMDAESAQRAKELGLIGEQPKAGGEEPGGAPGPGEQGEQGGDQPPKPSRGMSFASPSIREQMSFRTANQALKSQEHQTLKDYSNRLEKDVAKAYGYKPGQVSDVVGDWGNTAENSQKITHETPAAVRRVMSALMGLHGAQIATADFHEHEDGLHNLYNLAFNTDDAEEARKILDEHGLQNRSVTPKVKGQRVTAHIIDTSDDDATRGAIEKLIQKGHLYEAERKPGTAEFLGDPNGTSREAAAGEYRRVLQEARDQAAQSGQRGDEFHKLASWLEPYQREAERNFEQLRKTREYEKQAVAQDYAKAKVHRAEIPADQARMLKKYNNIGKKWVGEHPNIHPSSNFAYLLGRNEHPFESNDMDKAQIAEHFEKHHEKLDYSKEEHRDKAADIYLGDIMHALAGSHTGGKPSEAYGWYDRTIRHTIDKTAEIEPTIKTDPAHELAWKLGLAVTSQGQKVPENAESAWHVLQYYKKHGELPEDAKHFGGGSKANAMVKNFAKMNKLWKDLGGGTEGAQKLKELLLTKMTVGELKKNYGLKVSGESVKHTVRGAMGLGPKIGAFFSNLNGHFDPTTFDLWFSRDLNKTAGRMFNFKPKPQHLERMEKLLNKPHLMKSLPEGQLDTMKEELAALKAKGKDLTRTDALKTAPTIYQWAKTATGKYARSYGSGQRSYHPDFKTQENALAKGIHENTSQLSDAPRNSTERKQWRDIMDRLHGKLLEHGIDLTNADKQALGWYAIKDLFKLGGSNIIPNVDYLDAAYTLARRHKNGMLPDLTAKD